jgi:type IV/VI secretion system ImpK/VasF family protein
MTLASLCEPLFRKVCLLNRLARKGGSALSYDELRLEIEEIFKDTQKAAEADPRLRVQWQKLELPLIFFVDSMIAESNLAVAAKWNQNRLAYQRNELAGDEKFFDLLDETLNDPSDEATERLLIFYTCLGLGFTGWYTGQPEYLRGKMLDISHRIRAAIDSDKAAKLCPEAYQGVDTRDLVEAPASKLGGIAIVFVGLCLTVLAVEIYLFRTASLSLTDSLSAIASQESSK